MKQPYLWLGLASWIILSTGGKTNLVQAQIVPDSTLPVNSRVNREGSIERISGGSVAGGNLFHSFQEFSIPTGNTAWFDNPIGIENVITRVTGRSLSNIDGILRANGSANLFLLNPNGIIFGPNGRLEIGGSFVASTANRLLFADGSEFSSDVVNETPTLLTVSVPLGLQFPNAAASIQVQGTDSLNEGVERQSLGVQFGNTLALLGGSVSIRDRWLEAPGGRIILGGLATAGTIELNVSPTQSGDIVATFPAGVERADVSINDFAEIDVMAVSDDGGELVITARNIDIAGQSELWGGIIEGVNSPNSQAGDIILDATGAIAIRENSSIANRVESDANGHGGDIHIRANSLAIADSVIDTGTFGIGDAGNIFVRVNNQVALTGNSQLYSDVSPDATGNGGTIDIQAGTLSLTNGAKLEGSSNGNGDAGNIRIQATDWIEIAGVGSEEISPGQSLPIASSGIFTNNTEKASGSGGDIDINVPTGYLRIAEGGVLSARTENDQPGGNITVNVDRLEITGGGHILTTAFGRGLAGDIVINATGTVRIAGFDPTYAERYDQVVAVLGEEAAKKAMATDAADSSLQAASINSEGEGSGNITIAAGSLHLDNGLLETSTASEGDAGDVTIQVRDRILAENETQIYSATSADGAGGTISLKAGNEIAIANSFISSGLPLRAISQGNGGEIDLEDIFQGTGRGNSGEIYVEAGGSVRLSDGSELVTSTFSAGSAGDITIKASSIILTGDSYLVSSSLSAGNAGDVILQAEDRIEIRDSSIFSDALSPGIVSDSAPVDQTAVGDAGFIDLVAKNAIAISNSSVTTESFGAASLSAASQTRTLGSIFLSANTIELSNDTFLSATAQGGGFAGNVALFGDRISIADSYIFSDAFANDKTNTDNQSGGSAGFIYIAADDTIELQNTDVTAESYGSTLGENTPDSINDATEQTSGAILFSAPNVRLENNSIISTTIFRDGNAGDILIEAPNRFMLRGNSQILSNSEGNGNAGNIEIEAAEMLLNHGTIEASTVSGDGGDIVLRSQQIQLRQNSEITTSAGTAGGPGAGGNIALNALTLVGLENSDITANAFEGAGGFIEIDAKGIFGIVPRQMQTPDSDITAISQQNPSLSGEVAINSPDLDTSGLVGLPTAFVDVNDLIAQNVCQIENEQDAFIVTGRGGLPPNPMDQLSHSPVMLEWASGQQRRENRGSVQSIRPVSRRDRLIEAQGWVIAADGRVILTTSVPRVTPQGSAWVNAGCSTWKGEID